MFAVSRSVLERLGASQKFRFLLVGALNTVVGYALFATLLAVYGARRYLVSVVISHCVATTLSFALNRNFVFRDRGSILVGFLKFQFTYSVILTLDLVLLVALVEGLEWPALIAQAVCLVLLAIVSCLGHKYFSFYRKEKREPLR